MKKLTFRQIDMAELLNLPLDMLQRKADAIRQKNTGYDMDLCSIVNAKSGSCSEDCKFCAQSGHYNAIIDEYSLLNTDVIFDAAEKAQKASARRLGIVTSGRTLSKEDIKSLCRTIKHILKRINIDICLSLGTLSGDELKRLRDTGAKRYHHNLETSERFYPHIVSTHPYSLRLQTIKEAQKAGFEVCSGGVFGLGETWQDRIDMAIELNQLKVKSIPINFLVPIEGTPLENRALMTEEEALRTVCIYRILLPDRTVKLAAGRESVLKDVQEDIFASGCNGMLIGGYLTIKGRTIEKDKKLVERVTEKWKRRSRNS